MAVASFLLVVLFSIIGEMMTGSRRTVQSLMAANSAATAMDTIAADLGGLMPLEGNNEYLFVKPETSGSTTNAYLRFLSLSPNNATNIASPGQPCFVTYRLAQYDAKTLEVASEPANASFALFRSVTNATNSFNKMMDGSSLDASATLPTMDDFFANNVVEFSVQPMRGTNVLTGTPKLNDLVMEGNSPTGNNRPDTLMITIVTLDDTGAQRLRDGLQTLQEVQAKHGRVLTRRIRLRDVFTP